MVSLSRLDGRSASLSVLAVAALAAPAPVGAQQSGAERVRLPDIVVTATRTPTPADEVASSVSVITADEIRAKQQPLAVDLLGEVPGLTIVPSGPAGGQASVFIRGTNSNHTLALLDGIEINDPSNPAGALDFAHMATEGLDRIEVLRGPQGTLYGSDAIGGVVNFITARGEGPATAHLRLGGGSFETLTQSARVTGESGRFNFNIGGSLFRTGGETATPSRIRPAALPEEDDGYRNATARIRLGAAVTEDAEVNLFLHHIDTEADNDAGLEDPNSTADTTQTYVRLEGRLASFDGFLEQRFGYSLAYQKRKELDSADPGQPFEASENRSKGRKTKIDWQGDLHLAETNTLTVGAAYEVEAFTNDSLFLDQSFGAATISEGHANADDEIKSAFIQDQFRLMERVSGTVGARIDDHQSFGSEVTWRAALAYDHVETGTRIKGSYGTGFKAPALFQRFGSSVFTIPAFAVQSPFFGNPALDPETSKGWDLGFEQALADGAVRFGATYFRNEIEGLITSDPTFVTLINLNKVNSWGVESFLSVTPVDWLRFDLNYTYARAEDPTTGQEHVNRTPRHEIAATLAAKPTERLEVNLDLLYVGTYVDNDRVAFARIYNGGYTRLDLAARYDLMPGIALEGRVDNLLDRDYEQPDGFLHPGIGVYGGLSATF
ncbi:MAG: hypothetical protein CMM50_14045 [Rhodospirillaceae bacterium]|nr:hypothetical protein [Rhodospirillaceae bacterium]